MGIRYDDHAERFAQQKIIDLIRQRSGLKMVERDLKKFVSSMEGRMAVLNMTNAQDYCQKILMSHPGAEDEFIKLTSLIVNHETYFFRDLGHCAALEKVIIPQLIENHLNYRTLKVWSAGCSTGEEAYSLAIMFFRALPSWENWRVLILGTDISYAAVEKARLARYKENSMRTVCAKERLKYFSKEGDEWVLDPKIVSMVKFSQANLIDNAFPNTQSDFHTIDLIVCRNVFIYFHQQAIAQIMQKFEQTLAPGGILLLGHGEAGDSDMGSLKSHLIPGSFFFEKPLLPP